MCGRYTLSTPVEKLAEEFGLTGLLSDLPPSYNVAPSQEVAAIVAGGGRERRLELLRWGLIPAWADDPGIGSRMINARSETVAEKPSFRRAFKERHCLIPDGFYEWQKTNGGKQPYHLKISNGRPFVFAGLWESWSSDEEGELRSCTILTTDANDLVGKVHHRMPVILPPETYDLWLDPAVREAEQLLSLLVPYPTEEMEAYPVSRRVNNPSNNEPGCVESVA
jgi:putative SOS response-associated peptidase YedK